MKTNTMYGRSDRTDESLGEVKIMHTTCQLSLCLKP